LAEKLAREKQAEKLAQEEEKVALLLLE